MAKRKSGLLENVKTIVYAGLIAVGIRTFLLEPFNIPSGSMIPTLLVGDYLFVSKWSYGYSRYSFPFSPDLFAGRMLGSPPARGDVVVFKLPRDTNIDYIKRVIGLPGDVIQVRGGQLYINGRELPREPAGECNAADRGMAIIGKRYIETLPNGVRHPICRTREGEIADSPPSYPPSCTGPIDPNNTCEYKVPAGRFFAMGDNRDNSQDSRYLDAVGYVPMENLVGRAEFIFFSVDAEYPWLQVWQWPAEIRWERLFTGLH